MPNPINRRKRYEGQINKAVDYIRSHLAEKILLQDIASVVNISQYHFHRIFTSLLGETPNSFIKRIRLTKAATLLISNPTYSITEIAFEVGFSSSQIFAREFKDYFGQTPTEFRKEKTRWSKISNMDDKSYHIESNNSQASSYTPHYTSSNGRPSLIFKSKTMKSEIKVSKLPETTVAYIRHIGPYKGDAELFGKLFGEIQKWAGSRNLLDEKSVMYAVYYDDCDITDDEKAMMDICISVPKDTKVKGNISKKTIPGGEYAIGRFTIKEPKDYEKAWESVYKDWLPESGYQADDRPSFEMYRSDGKDKKQEGYEHKVEICVPVKAA